MTYVTSEMRELVSAAVAHYVAIANSKLDWKRVFSTGFTRPSVSFDLKGATAGKAYYRTNSIQLNAQLLAKNLKAFIMRTVPHEIAHLVAYRYYGSLIKPHGNEWKYIMSLFEAEATRCHSYDVTGIKRKQQTFDFVCGCPGKTIAVTARRLAEMKKGRRYICSTCKIYIRSNTVVYK